MRRKAYLVLMAGILAAAFTACANEETVYLEDGSQGEPGNSIIYGLDSGSMYLVRQGQTWYPVKSDGTVGGMLSQLNNPELGSAITAGELQPLDSGVTEIKGFTNNDLLCVYKYGKPDNSFFITPWNSMDLGLQYVTWQRNIVIDLSLITQKDLKVITFAPDVTDEDSVFIFVTPDLINAPQDVTVTGGSSPNISGGSDWEYVLGGTGNTSEASPLKINVSVSQGQKGYFSLSGSMPEKITITSKKASQDPDRPST